jgi:hypothetical protein
MVDVAQERGLLDGKDGVVQPPTGLPPTETGTRIGQLAGKAVAGEQANSDTFPATLGAGKTD